MGGVFYYPAVQYVDRSVITPTNPPLPLIRINWPDPTYLPSSAPILLSQYTASATQSTHPYSAYCPVPLCKIVDLQPRVCVTEAHEVTREVGETAGLVAEQRSQAVGRMECEVEDDSEDDEESVSVMGVVQPVFHADTDTATIEMASTAPVAPAVQPPVAVLPAVSAIKQEERRAVKPLITATCGPCTTPPLSASPLTSPSASMPAAEQGQTKAAEVKREERQAVRHTPPPAPAISVVATASTAPPAPPLRSHCRCLSTHKRCRQRRSTSAATTSSTAVIHGTNATTAENESGTRRCRSSGQSAHHRQGRGSQAAVATAASVAQHSAATTAMVVGQQ